MTQAYKYGNGVVLSEPRRYTATPVWAKKGRLGGWHKFIPAEIEYAGEETYYKGHADV